MGGKPSRKGGGLLGEISTNPYFLKDLAPLPVPSYRVLPDLAEQPKVRAGSGRAALRWGGGELRPYKFSTRHG